MLQISKSSVKLIEREQKLNPLLQGIHAFGDTAIITNGFWVVIYTLPEGLKRSGIYAVTDEGLNGPKSVDEVNVNFLITINNYAEL